MQLVQEPTPPPEASDAEEVTLGGYRYADIWKRLAAFQIDVMLLTGILPAILAAFGYSITSNEGKSAFDSPWPFLIWGGIVLVYYVWMDASRWQGTLGKTSLGMKVVTVDGGRVPVRWSLVRLLARVVVLATGGIGFIILQGYPKKQALHDKLSKQVVVYKEEEARNEVSSLPRESRLPGEATSSSAP